MGCHRNARANINPQFPHAITAKFVVTKITQLKPIYAAIHRNARFVIAQLQPPIEIEVFAVISNEMADFVIETNSSINEELSRAVMVVAVSGIEAWGRGELGEVAP